MIKKVKLKYFKRFAEQSFRLDDYVVLAGPNNAGKTTLLQAIATWHFAFRAWQKKKSASTSKQRGGVSLTRKEFLAVPVQRFNLLWTDASTALKRNEGGGRGAANPRIMEISLEGDDETKTSWQHTMKFRHANSELVYANPGLVYANPIEASTIPAEEIKVVYIPSFSGIETEEKVHTPEYQDWLIGQGKPGDIIRNLLVETHSNESAWKSLCADVETMFGYHLLEPRSAGRPFILCEYRPDIPKKRGPKLDIASAGSGFLQALLLLSFFYARPSTILLIDEPDAHMHVILQKQIFDHLRKVAAEKKCQIILATHSEVLIDNTPPNKIISFYNDEPRNLIDNTERDGVREALKYLTSMDILLARRGKILYVEDNSDFDILRAWATTLDHPLQAWFSDPFYFPIKGSHPRRAKKHLFSLRAVEQNTLGVLVLDGDNRNMLDREVSADGLHIIRWTRYEIESYLVHPEAMKRFVEKKLGPLFSQAAMTEMENILPPEVMKSPLGNHDYMNQTKASKNILPRIFSAAGIDISKQEYYKLAEEMEQKEIHPEIKEKLDAIAAHWKMES